MKNLKYLGLHFVIALVSMFFALSLSAAGNAKKGKSYYGTCVSCHGATGMGNQALNAPRIGGLPAWYVARQLKNYQKGIRGTGKDIAGAAMRGMAMTVPGSKADDVAAYVATLKPKKAKKTLKGDAKAGKAKFALCASCHGPTGKGNKALNAPPLAGQQDWYIKQQLQNFKKGIRGIGKDIYGMQMRPMVATLTTDKDLDNISVYISELK